MRWINLFKKKAKRKFKFKFVSTGFMSNRYLIMEVIEEMSDFDIKKDQILTVTYNKYRSQLKRHYKTKRDGSTEYLCFIEELI